MIYLFVFFFLLALITLIAGLIDPKWVSQSTDQAYSRGQVCKRLVLPLIFCSTLSVLTFYDENAVLSTNTLKSLFSVKQTKDISSVNVKRYRTRILLKKSVTNDQIKQIADMVASDFKKTKPFAGLVLFFYNEGTSLNGVYSRAKAVYAPNGIWANTKLVKLGNYDAHHWQFDFVDQKTQEMLANLSPKATVANQRKYLQNNLKWLKSVNDRFSLVKKVINQYDSNPNRVLKELEKLSVVLIKMGADQPVPPAVEELTNIESKTSKAVSKLQNGLMEAIYGLQSRKPSSSKYQIDKANKYFAETEVLMGKIKRNSETQLKILSN